MIRKTLAACVALAAFAAFAQPAAAASHSRLIAVSVADLDLSREAGAQAALNRIERAAQQACGDTHQRPAPLYERAAYRACVDDAEAYAIRALGAPLVSRLSGRHGAFASR